MMLRFGRVLLLRCLVRMVLVMCCLMMLLWLLFWCRLWDGMVCWCRCCGVLWRICL